jgi:hypothetical protein
MPKKKKTRKQKMMADVRAESTNSLLYSFVPKTPLVGNNPSFQEKKIQSKIITDDYQYLGKDLRNITIITLFVVLIELTIRYFL